MLYAKWRDFQPELDYHDYSLGLMVHDDGDCIKWDWTVYKFAKTVSYEGLPMQLTHDMFEEVCNLDISPYERNTKKIKEIFLKKVEEIS